MRAGLLTISFILLITKSIGQNTDITYSESVESESRTERYRYLDPDDYEQKTLFKLSGVQNRLFNETLNGQTISVSVERKLSHFLSLELGLGELTQNRNIRYAPDLFGNLRFYTGKIKQEAKNNFSGFYVGLGVLYDDIFKNDFRPRSDISRALTPSGTFYNLSFGKQQKVGKWGYYDISSLLSYSAAANSFQFGLSFSSGIGYGKFEENIKPDDSSSEVENLFDRTLWKINNPAVAISEPFQSASISFQVEKYLHRNFTLGLNFGSGYSNQKSEFRNNEDLELRSFAAGVSGTLRWYYNLNKRAQKGFGYKSFHGNYLFFNTSGPSYAIVDSNFDDIENRFDGFEYEFSFFVGWGLQRRIGKRGFMDFKTGFFVPNKTDRRENLLDPEFEVTANIGLLLGKLK